MKPLPFLVCVALFCFDTSAQLDVSIKADGKDTNILRIIKLPAATDGQPAGMSFNNLDIGEVLNIYSELTDHTVLRSPRIKKVAISVSTSSTNRADNAQAIEKALSERGLVTIPDGRKFVMVVPQTETKKVRPYSAEIVCPAGNSSSEVSGEEIIPTGGTSFPIIDLERFADIYGELVSLKFVKGESMDLRGKVISLNIQSPLCKAEVLYALDTLLEWDGVKMVPFGTNSIKAVSIAKP